MILKKLLFLLPLFMMNCTVRSCDGQRKDIAPEEQLHSYISLAVNIARPEQKEDLLQFATGSLKGALVNVSPESFQKAYIDRRYTFNRFEVLEIQGDEKEKNIDFKISYKTWLKEENPDQVPQIETINRASLVYEQGRWAIDKVISLNTDFSWENGIPVGPNTPTGPVKDIISSRELIDTE